MNFTRGINLEQMIEYDQEWLTIYPLQPTDYEKQHGIWPLRIGANIAKSNYHIGPRVTQYYYLLCVLEGEGTFIHQKRSILYNKTIFIACSLKSFMNTIVILNSRLKS